MEKDNRTKFIQVPVKESEKEIIKKLANEKGLPMAVYMRMAAMKCDD